MPLIMPMLREKLSHGCKKCVNVWYGSQTRRRRKSAQAHAALARFAYSLAHSASDSISLEVTLAP
jgi:hypothetical protein